MKVRTYKLPEAALLLALGRSLGDVVSLETPVSSFESSVLLEQPQPFVEVRMPLLRLANAIAQIVSIVIAQAFLKLQRWWRLALAAPMAWWLCGSWLG